MVPGHRASPDSLLTTPVFIIGCNRSGTTVLFRTLSAHPTLWSRYIENRDCFIDLFPNDGPEGDRVTRANHRQQSRMSQFLYDNAKNRELVIGTPVLEHLPLKLFQKPLTDLFKSPPLPIVDKTPSNCFRVEMLADAYPDARFVYIARRGEAVVSSLMEGWKNWTETDGTWSYRRWHYLKPPGWKDFQGEKNLTRICAFQYRQANLHAMRALGALEKERHIRVRHEDLITDPGTEYDRIREFLELPASPYWDQVVNTLDERVLTRGGSPPQPGKWQRLHGREVANVQHLLEPINEVFYDGEEHRYTA